MCINTDSIDFLCWTLDCIRCAFAYLCREAQEPHTQAQYIIPIFGYLLSLESYCVSSLYCMYTISRLLFTSVAKPRIHTDRPSMSSGWGKEGGLVPLVERMSTGRAVNITLWYIDSRNHEYANSELSIQMDRMLAWRLHPCEDWEIHTLHIYTIYQHIISTCIRTKALVLSRIGGTARVCSWHWLEIYIKCDYYLHTFIFILMYIRTIALVRSRIGGIARACSWHGRSGYPCPPCGSCDTPIYWMVVG